MHMVAKKKTFGSVLNCSFFYVQRKLEVALFTSSASQRDKDFTILKFKQCYLDLNAI